jgi:hypothetical protein
MGGEVSELGVKTHSDGRAKMSDVNASGSVDVDEAESWVRSWVPITGPLKLFQTKPWASIPRAPVDGGVVWFKACAPRQFFEVPHTAALPARRDAETEVLAHDLDRGRLLMADAGEPLRVLGNPPERWLEILTTYTKLQIDETSTPTSTAW